MSDKTTIFIDTQDMEERYGEELYKEYLEKENNQLKEVIEEARKWINNHTIEWIDEKFEVYNEMIGFDEYANPLVLLDILDKAKDDKSE